MQRITYSFRLAVVALVCALSAGCSGGKGKPTKANFDKIMDGMSVQQVEELMGPAKTSLDMSHLSPKSKDVSWIPKAVIYVWEDGETDYHVNFYDDKVKAKDMGP